MTELRLATHHLTGGEMMIEIWHDGAFIGGIYPAKNGGGGVDITTKYRLTVSTPTTEAGLTSVQVRIAR